MIAINNLVYEYPQNELGFHLGPISLTIEPGIPYHWKGHNGSGKSTAAQLICGNLEPLEGTIEELPSQCAYYSQALDQNIFPDLTLSQHTKLYTQSSPRSINRLNLLYEFFPQVLDLTDHYPDQLSGGQRQILGFITAVLAGHQLYVFDEIFNHLDPDAVKNVTDALISLLDEDPSLYVIAIAHNQVNWSCTYKTVTFKEGRII